MDVEQPLDFELEDPLLTAPCPATTKRKKVIGLDDLLSDHYKEETKFVKIDSKTLKSSRCHNSDEEEDEDKVQSNKEKELHKLVDDCHKQVHEMSTEFEIPLWGLQVFGHQKEPPPLSFTDIDNCKILQFVSKDEHNLNHDLYFEKGGTFCEGLLVSGWLLRVVHACGYVEDSVASWTFKRMLYSSNEELHLSACDFWCGILQATEDNVPSVKLGWFPNYSEIKAAIETYGYLFGCHNKLSSSNLAGCGSMGLPMNIKSWVRFVSTLCRLRSIWPKLLTFEVEELLPIIISLFLDRRLQGFSLLFDQCVRSVLSFFTEAEWHASCKKITNYLAQSIPKDLNCLRIVECISLVDNRSKNLRSQLAFQILMHCFEKDDADAKEVLKFLLSVNMKEKNCDFVKLYIYLILAENWLCIDPFLEESSIIFKLWYKFLKNCSVHVSSTDWRPYAAKVRNRASYLLQTPSVA